MAEGTEATARHLIATLDRHDLAALRDLWHPDLEEHFVATGRRLDREGTVAEFAGIFAAFPDFSITAERVHVDGSTAVVEWRITGTHTGGPFEGIAATGRAIELQGIDVMELADGLLRRNTIYYDATAIGRALGLLPADGSPGHRALLAAFNGATALRRRLQPRPPSREPADGMRGGAAG